MRKQLLIIATTMLAILVGCNSDEPNGDNGKSQNSKVETSERELNKNLFTSEDELAEFIPNQSLWNGEVPLGGGGTICSDISVVDLKTGREHFVFCKDYKCYPLRRCSDVHLRYEVCAEGGDYILKLPTEHNNPVQVYLWSIHYGATEEDYWNPMACWQHHRFSLWYMEYLEKVIFNEGSEFGRVENSPEYGRCLKIKLTPNETGEIRVCALEISYEFTQIATNGEPPEIRYQDIFFLQYPD